MAGYPRPALVVAALALGILGGCSDSSDGPSGSPQPVDAQVDPTATTPPQPTLARGGVALRPPRRHLVTR